MSAVNKGEKVLEKYREAAKKFRPEADASMVGFSSQETIPL